MFRTWARTTRTASPTIRRVTACAGSKLATRPLKLLEQVRGLELVPLEKAEECCGFGGTFAIKNADTSTAMLSDKVRCILNGKAEVCAAADNSCLMHIGGALHRGRTGVRTVHLAEILASTEEATHV